MSSSIKKDYFWNTLGVFLQSAMSPLLLVAVTRINGIQISGVFSFAFSVSMIFLSFGMWGGRMYQVSDSKREFSQRSYVMLRVLLSVIMLTGAIIFSFVNHYDLHKSAVIILLVMFKATESLADALYGVLQIHNKLYVAGKSLVYKAVTGMTIFVIVDLLTHSILLGAASLILVNLTYLLAYDLRIAHSLDKVTIPIRQLTYYTKIALNILYRTAPVFLVAFLLMFIVNIPRYFIDRYQEDQIGYFGIIAMPITLIILTVSFLLQPNVVNLASLHSQKNKEGFRRIVNRLLLASLGAGVVILILTYCVGTQVLGAIFGISFTDYKTALVLLMLGGVFNAVVAILTNILVIARRFSMQTYLLLLTNISLGIMSAILVPKYGLDGAVKLYVAISIIQAMLLFVLYKIYLGKSNGKN